MESLSNWDEDYIRNVVLPYVEAGNLEKKAAGKFTFTSSGKVDAATTEELAKQVCGFANSGAGYIVYGITDDNRLDVGVSTTVGRQPTKDWVEAQIPNLVYPSLSNCE